VQYEAKLHWAIFLPGIILTPVLVGLLLLLAAYIRMMTSEFAVTNKRIIIKTGWISRKTLEMNLAQIENIGVDQGILGRILGYGTIKVSGTGGVAQPFPGITNPLEFRKSLQAASM
jgi:uncharacterized membrane protein YdbT with pleckstrin-like domain